MDWQNALRIAGILGAIAASAFGGGAFERRQTTECQAGYQLATSALSDALLDALERCEERCRTDAP